ncbi:hypothetical protein [Acanthamoeba castellanii mimivirus]|uniref:Uncharacterized protein L676 n=5 Tax=Mimivirus TaxID=315393 RepID=YL676_MIMIV|nr:hypothetical protein MIMI_gp0728 [Acanthamoeba polyphaga mimivirus]Q5UNU0.1 RecName: Full=Uncharacterized protein L676 [Acanthamoeba polyphaga mimivirus]AEQ60883.1 hypothetical protein [Acanthamoeba castellanii mamavirus]AHA45162.1 hypothetical protein HIRU_S256 [Hirudovirus strain Sangsue]AHJ40304.1 hypothetical protein [Samba virus]ALR84266.1 hypothetical protein [Niemeyer virus]AMZ03119.1 hypothetical protein [Mimivirus Bombay]QTF49611.1 hypothetical protein [Mimivirus reunion]WMV6205
MTTFDLDDFLKSYKPKKVDLSSYTNHTKLKGYTYITKDDFNNLIPNRTYIKYILRSDVGTENNISKQIHCGGFFLSGGNFSGKKFVQSDDWITWTHLFLKYCPHPESNLNGEFTEHKFYLKTTKYYLFYRYYDKKSDIYNLKSIKLKKIKKLKKNSDSKSMKKTH